MRLYFEGPKGCLVRMDIDSGKCRFTHINEIGGADRIEEYDYVDFVSGHRRSDVASQAKAVRPGGGEEPVENCTVHGLQDCGVKRMEVQIHAESTAKYFYDQRMRGIYKALLSY